MKALTLRHPWPYAFVGISEESAKRVENRTWEPPRKLLGEYIALHGGSLPSGAKLAEVRADALYIANTILEDETGDPDMTDADLPDSELLGMCIPGIFAVARLTRVVTSSDSPWFFGPFGWELDSLTRIDPPVPHVGAQGLWDVQPAALALLRERYKLATRPAAPAAPQHTEVSAPDVPAPASVPLSTCGTCDHWTPTTPSMGQCQLGWEAHDNLRDSKGKSAMMGHGGLALPEMQAGCSCAAIVGGRAGYVLSRGLL